MSKLNRGIHLLAFGLSLLLLAACTSEGAIDEGAAGDNSGGDTAVDGAGGEITAPGDVTEFTATAGDGSVTLNWVNPEDEAFAGVMIRRSTESYPLISDEGEQVLDGQSISFTDTGLTNGTAYYYTAFAHDGLPEYSGGVQTMATPLIPAPAGLAVAAAVAGGALTISWDPVAGAAGYNLYRATVGGVSKETGDPIAGVTSPHTDSGLIAGAAYYYVVTALDATSESADSAEAGGTPIAAAESSGLTLDEVTTPTHITPQIIGGGKEADTSIRINGSEAVPLDANTTWSWSMPLVDGGNPISVTSLDADGVASRTVTAIIFMDTLPPGNPTLNAVTSPTNIPSQVIGGTKEPSTSIWVNGMQRVALNNATVWNWSMPLSEGNNSISVISKDGAGNGSARGAVSAVITLDSTPPPLPTLNPVTSPTNVTPQTIDGGKAPNSSVWINGGEVAPLDAATTWSWSMPLAEGGNAISLTSKGCPGQ